MKIVVLILFMNVLALLAVEWEKEQLTNDVYYHGCEPRLALDSEGYIRILFDWSGGMRCSPKVASNINGGWDINDVASSWASWSSEFCWIDVDSRGNTFVTFIDTTDSGYKNLFLSCDTTGNFVSVNITDDDPAQAAPIVKVNNKGIPHILYSVVKMPENYGELYFGWFDKEGFKSKQVVENLFHNCYTGYDFVFGKDFSPHIFYIGDDGYLWYATSYDTNETWETECINKQVSRFPSVTLDDAGSFHIAYRAGDTTVHYITNKSASWQDEAVSDGGTPEDDGDFHPSLALDSQGSPYIAWIRFGIDIDIYYAGRGNGSWIVERFTPQEGEHPGKGRFFSIDPEGHGHLVYERWVENWMKQVFHARSIEPLVTKIMEQSPKIKHVAFTTCGSSIYFTLLRPSIICLNLYNSAGKMLCQLVSGRYSVGKHSVFINTNAFPAGVYFVQGDIAGFEVRNKVLILH